MVCSLYRNRGLVFSLLLVFVLSMGVVSAGWFGDFLGRITGKVSDVSSCSGQNCDSSPRDGMIDAGKVCTGIFYTEYFNQPYASQLFERWVGGNGRPFYFQGENYTPRNGPYEYVASGNCSQGLYPRIVGLMYSNVQTEGGYWTLTGGIRVANTNCSQNGVDYCSSSEDKGLSTPSGSCVDQGCDNGPADGVVDSGKSCSGSFSTWYTNSSYVNLGSRLSSDTNSTYMGGEWFTRTRLERGNYWYYAWGNCTLGLHPRYIWINETSGLAWGNFSCLQNRTPYNCSPSTSPSSCVDQECDNGPADGIVDSGKSCSGTFYSWYNNSNFIDLGQRLSSGTNSTYIGGEWFVRITGSWYWASGDCVKGTHSRFLYINETTGYAGGNFNCTRAVCPPCPSSLSCVTEPVICPADGKQVKKCWDGCSTSSYNYSEYNISCNPGECSGCQVGTRCLGPGARQDGKYCSYDWRMENQKSNVGNAEANCSESFECSSNLCSSGRCVDIGQAVKELRGLKLFFVKVACRLSAIFKIQGDSVYSSCVLKNAGVSVTSEGSGPPPSG